ncbi:UNVERIFIED_CONTAM: hypothetical protein Sradi_0910300 [Sesamum radiatum]|uniref:Uncharacterized protein n=1 Tax=Sesamum radiatum TaxID=300843 RepID=A0AAW2V3Y0_SESRA
MGGGVVVGGSAMVTGAGAARRCEQRPGPRRGGASGEAHEREQMCRSGARCGGARD